MKKKTKTGLSALLVTALALPMLAFSVSAEENEQKVRVIIENNTLSVEDGAAWAGTLADEWVSLTDGTTATSAFLSVIEKYGYTQTGADIDYITEINGLSAEDGGEMGGWMFSLDDWFTDEGISAYSVAFGKLEGGDEIRFSYSCSWGADLGYDWSGSDTSLSDVILSDGVIIPDFSGDNHEYFIELPKGTESITVRPVVMNKAYRAKVYKNDYTPASPGTDYKFTEEMPVTDGDVIIVGVASPAWMQANYNDAPENIYVFNINTVSETDPMVQACESSINAIGTVSRDSLPMISAARKYYDSLSDEQKAMVTCYDILVAAEKAYAELEVAQPYPSLSQLRENSAEYLAKAPVFGNEWDVIALARMSLMDEDMKQSYINSIKEAVKENTSDRLSSTRSTVNSGVVAALTAIGIDPTDFCGYDLTRPLNDTDYVTQQGLNGAVYALIALDTHGYGSGDAREKYLSAILDAQESDGGWTIDTWSGTDDGSDADMTAMCIQALTPHLTKDESSPINTAVAKAVDFLSTNTKPTGFVSYGSVDSESCAQVLIAVCGLTDDPDSCLTVNGKTVYELLLGFYNDNDKGFAHLAGGESNYISSYQGYTAAAAYYRCTSGMSRLYDMTDESLEAVPADPEESSEPSKDQESSDPSGGEPSAPSVKPEEKTVHTGESPLILVITMLAAIISCAAIFFGSKKHFSKG